MAPSLTDHEDDLRSALARLEKHARYAEVMAERRAGDSLTYDRNQRNYGTALRQQGAVFRAWAGDRWIEAAASELSRESLHATADGLAHVASAWPSGSDPPGKSPHGSAERTLAPARPLHDLPVEERLDWAKSVFDWASAVEGVREVHIRLSESEDERLFLAFGGARRYQALTRSVATAVPMAIENGRVEYDFLSAGITGGAEVLDDFTEEKITKLAEGAKALLGAKEAPTGRLPVVLDPDTTGTFAHESFGHGTEADQALRQRSYLAPLVGETLGPDALTIVDNGAYESGFGTIFFDDEGQPGQRTVIVDRGRFDQLLTDRVSAAQLRTRTTGNTRRADFSSRPFVRMTNTYVEPADWSLDEMIREAKDGVLLERCTSGIEDPLGGNMQIKVKKARRIERGELTDLYSSMALSGRVLEFLRSIRAVSHLSDFRMSSGHCGKGHTDILPVGSGGPYLLAEAVVGPA